MCDVSSISQFIITKGIDVYQHLLSASPKHASPWDSQEQFRRKRCATEQLTELDCDALY